MTPRAERRAAGYPNYGTSGGPTLRAFPLFDQDWDESKPRPRPMTRARFSSPR